MSLKQIWQAANPKGHLLTAISFLIPIVCGSGFIIAIGMGLGGTVQDTLTPGQFDVWQAMATLGAKALGLLPVVIAVGISGSIAGKPGIARICRRAGGEHHQRRLYRRDDRWLHCRLYRAGDH
mgnify:CR=1 FL=1